MKDIYDDLPNKYVNMLLLEVWRHGGTEDYVITQKINRGIGSRLRRDSIDTTTTELLSDLSDDGYLKMRAGNSRKPGRPSSSYKLTRKGLNFLTRFTKASKAPAIS